jgi:hypothetical protein
MPGHSDALKGKVSERALEALEMFTRHGALNIEDVRGWHEFIVYTHLDGRHADRDALREHLKATRSEDSEERTEEWIDLYEEGLEILKTYDRLAPRAANR